MVSADIVYKTVLLILNKEQRGYMTPFEFNNIATQVQREIFEAYFEVKQKSINSKINKIDSVVDFLKSIKFLDKLNNAI